MEHHTTNLTRDREKDKGTRELAIANIRALEGEGSERKFELSFASDEPYNRWWGTEILECTEEAVDLTRLSEIGVLLFNHDRGIVLGKVNRTWIENNRCKAEVEFDTDEEAEKIYQKVKSGTLKGVSVSYSVSNWEEVEAGEKSLDGKYEGPCSIAKKWAPYEISIVSVPADPTVGVGRSFKEDVKLADTYERQVLINKNRIRGGKVC